MERHPEGQSDGFETSPAAAADELVARVDELLGTFRAHTPVPDDAIGTLRTGIVSLARQHAAETVHRTITARAEARDAKRARRSWSDRPELRRRPQARP
jgi:hypothetical protein